MSNEPAVPILARSPRIILRAKRVEDAENDYRWRTDPELARLDGAEPLQVGFEEFLRRYPAETLGPWPDRELYAIETSEGAHIGNLMVYNLSPSLESAEVGITIGEAHYRGRGYGTEAMVTFMRWAWSARPWRRLVLHTLEWNERARRCFARVGFQPTAIVLRRGERYVRMEALREWWLLWEAEGRFQFPNRSE
ncbi:hypothetical protein HRbin29_00748 [bacterium HR29]|nr:hypothetical protein HRbin29_00748 [bacterium HR29]